MDGDSRIDLAPPARRWPATLSWLQVGDLHMDADDGWCARARLAAIVAEAAALGDAIDFVFLPGDNANHAEPDQYAQIVATLAPLRQPWRVIPGDHDFEDGTLAAYRAAFPAATRPDVEVIAGHRCLFLDIVSAGTGGPDFRLTTHQRNRIAEELARAEAEAQTPVVFMHGYPGDLARDGDALARGFAEAGVAFVATGHTHYNEILNDGRVVYAATRSTAQVEEGGGAPGYAIVSVRDRVPSWRFKPIGTPWPLVQIVAPADARLVTRPADPRQVPRPGTVAIVARLFGASAAPPRLCIDGEEAGAMARRADGLWYAAATLDEGLHHVAVAAAHDRDTIRVLVRAADATPRRPPPVAPGCAVHAIGAWPERGIDGAQLGPNRNGRRW